MTAMISGGFDPLHVGHLDLIEFASAFGDLIVVVNSDAWLMRKKGYVFMPVEDRARIIAKLPEPTSVVPVDDSDGTVCEALRRYQPKFFINGGDRMTAHPLEDAVCHELRISQVFAGEKVRSSSALVEAVR